MLSRPRDQVQVVAPGGNFPGPNVVPGLPVNEWVHIAIVYDNTTKERIYYKDGVPVYKDEAASGNVSLSSGCYIGRAWDDTRWVAGRYFRSPRVVSAKNGRANCH